jgi:tRNA(Leu) C34 or U34 (ribose-2'-O)-methylase TrmL/HEAT repeat protein
VSAPLSPEAAQALDTALYDADVIARDTARGRLAAQSEPAVLAALVRALDAPDRVTRRRASRLLGEAKPARVRPLLLALVEDTAASERHRATAVRLLSLLSPQAEPALAALLTDPSPRVRRAAATLAAPEAALQAALADSDAVVVSSALSALVEREHTPDAAALSAALERHGDALADARRWLAAGAPDAAWVVEAAAAGDAGALDHLAWGEAAEAAFGRLSAGPTRVAALWARARAGHPDPAWGTDPDPRVRAALARALPPDHPALAALLQDADPGVRWMAERAAAGAFAPEVLARRTARHARLDAPSARPPYGLSADDAITAPPRAPGALALCHTRFDVNLGVAVRSAEAAGLSEVFLVGRGEMLRSPARGTEHVIPVTPVADAAALQRRAREAGYQLVAVQQTPDSVPYHRAVYPPRPLFVLGAEDEGVPPALRRAADLVVEIPQWGVIDSLNVAAAATCVMFHWRAHRDA